MKLHLLDAANPQRWVWAWGAQAVIDFALAWWLGGFTGVILFLIGAGCLGLAIAHLGEHRRRCSCGHQFRTHPDPKSCYLCSCDDYDGAVPSIRE